MNPTTSSTLVWNVDAVEVFESKLFTTRPEFQLKSSQKFLGRLSSSSGRTKNKEQFLATRD